jgi:heterodisulfide reductase subunit D
MEPDMEQLMEELQQCRRCGICRNAVYDAKGFDGICPVYENSTGFETSFMRGKIIVALALLNGELEKTAKNSESLFDCTLCGNCAQICPAEFEPAHTLEAVRGVLAEVPNQVRGEIAQKILSNNNPYGENNPRKRSWVSELDFDIPVNGETLYFVGCTAGMRIPKVAKNTAKILKASGLGFAILEDEPCCGSVLLRTGNLEAAAQTAERISEAIEESGAERIVVSCAGCLKTLKEDFPNRFDIKLPEVLHILELVDNLIREGKLKLKALPGKNKVTYHDPCHMGRELAIYESPRRVIQAIPNVNLVEMETNRETAMCCGAGGGLRSYNSDLAKNIASKRVKDAIDTGANILATACPFCEHNLLSGTKVLGEEISIKDVVSLLAESVE